MLGSRPQAPEPTVARCPGPSAGSSRGGPRRGGSGRSCTYLLLLTHSSRGRTNEGKPGGADLPSRSSPPQPPKAKRTSRRSSAVPTIPSGPSSSLAVPGAGKTVRRSRSREVLPEPPQQVAEQSEPDEEPAPPPPPPVAEEEKPKKKHRESAKVSNASLWAESQDGVWTGH